MKNINYKEVFEIVCRLYVFFFLTFYGVGKIVGGQFYTPDLVPIEIETMPIKEITNFDLAWVFMGRSFGYILFIGIAEILGAILLLFNKTKLIGTFILVPIMINIIVFDIFFLDKYGALASAIIYLIMLFSILLIHKEKIIKVIKTLVLFEVVSKETYNEKLIKFSVVLFLISIIFIFDQFLVNWLGHGKG